MVYFCALFVEMNGQHYSRHLTALVGCDLVRCLACLDLADLKVCAGGSVAVVYFHFKFILV